MSVQPGRADTAPAKLLTARRLVLVKVSLNLNTQRKSPPRPYDKTLRKLPAAGLHTELLLQHTLHQQPLCSGCSQPTRGPTSVAAALEHVRGLL